MSVEHIIVAGAVVTALTAIVLGVRRFVGWCRRVASSSGELYAAVRDTNLGRDEVRDSITGEVIHPPVPSIGVRMAQVEEGVEQTRGLQVQTNELMQQMLDVVQSQQHQDTRLDDHESRIGALEGASDERTITRAESLTHLVMLARAQGLDLDELAVDVPEDGL